MGFTKKVIDEDQTGYFIGSTGRPGLPNNQVQPIAPLSAQSEVWLLWLCYSSWHMLQFTSCRFPYSLPLQPLHPYACTSLSMSQCMTVHEPPNLSLHIPSYAPYSCSMAPALPHSPMPCMSSRAYLLVHETSVHVVNTIVIVDWIESMIQLLCLSLFQWWGNDPIEDLSSYSVIGKQWECQPGLDYDYLYLTYFLCLILMSTGRRAPVVIVHRHT